MTVLSPFDIVCAARMAVYRRAPYWMKMLFKLAPVEKPGAGTFYVDEKLRVHFDPAMAVKWGVEHCATFLAHELQHPLRDHLRRGVRFVEEHGRKWKELQPWLKQQHPLLGVSPEFFWNVVADLEINPCVIEMGFEFPPGFTPVFPATFKLPPGKFAEEYAGLLFHIANKRRKVEQGTASTPPPAMPSQRQPEPDEDPTADEAPMSSDPNDYEEADDEVEEAHEADERDGGQEHGGDTEAERRDGDAEGDGAREADDAAEGEEGAGEDDGGSDADGEAQPDTRPFEGCCGGCSGNHHKDEERLAPAGLTDSQVDVARRQVAHDTLEPSEEMKRVMNQFGRGTVPGAMQGWAKAELTPPEVPWQRILTPLVRSAVAYARGRVDWRYGRPSRRREMLKQTMGDAAPLLPTLVAPTPSIAIVVDTSGSMQAEGERGTLLDEALSEVVGIVLATGVPCWAAAVDAGVQAWVQVKRKEDASKLVKGGGGTDMRLGIAAAEEKKCDVIVLVTDGYTPWPTPEEMPKRSRLVTCIVGECADVPKHIAPLVRCNPRKEAIQWPSKN